MKTFSINTFGCKVNQYESQQIRQFLEGLGLSELKPLGSPDLMIINTCCVTATASAKSRQCIRRMQKLNPAAFTVISGCLPTIQDNCFDSSGKNTHIIRNRKNLGTTLRQIVEVGKGISNCVCRQGENGVFDTENGEKNEFNFAGLTSFKGHTRAFLKVQDGCDGYCSYCIVPKTRPKVWSREVADVLQEAQGLVGAGHKEIVVTGIYLGAFGQASVRRKKWEGRENNRLAELLEKLAEVPGLERIRLSSLEPGDVTERLLDVFCGRCNIMPHLHLSLQSGSEAVLRRMCRQYGIEEFMAKIEMIKSRLDRPAITTDLIVGFPGETDDDFEQTVSIARQVGFSKMHIFPFSVREGTAAAVMQDMVDKKVIKRRSQVLRDMDKELGSKFRQQFIGETATILLENGNGRVCGRSERYFMVFLNNRAARGFKSGKLLRVRLVGDSENGVIGENR